MIDDGAPTLSVGFEIDFGDAFGGLKTLDDLIGKAAADGVRQFQQLERAVAGGLGLGEAAVQFRAFGNAVNREMQTAAQATAAAEKAGEGMVRNLERQVETFGKTASEIRNMRAEMKAVAAEAQGLTELAGRIRTANQALVDMENAEDGVHQASGRMSASGMEMMHVVRSSADSFAAGAAPMQIFAMEMGRVAEAAALAGGGSGALGAIGAFLGGPWGIALVAGTAILTPFVAKLFETDDAAKAAEKGLKEFEDRQADLGRFIDANTGKLKEQMRVLAQIALQQGATLLQTAAKPGQDAIAAGFAAAKAALAAEGHSRSGPNDADLSRAIMDANGNIAVLNRNVAQLAAHRSDLAGLSQTLGGFAGQAQESANAIHKAQGEQAALNVAVHGGVVMTSSLVDQQVALGTATTGVERAQAALAEVKARGAAIDDLPYGDKRNAQLRQYSVDLTNATNAVKAAQAAQKSAAADRRADHSVELHAQQLQRDADAVTAQTINLYALSKAYAASGGDALLAEARVKAESQAIKQRGDVEATYMRQVQLAIAQRVADAAKSTAAMTQQAAVQTRVNADVAAGLIPASQAAQLVRDQIADLPMLGAIKAAQAIKDTAAAQTAIDQLFAQRAARQQLSAAEAQARVQSGIAEGGDRLDDLKEELKLVGATTAERVHQLTVMTAYRQMMKDITAGVDLATAYKAFQITVDTADATEQLRLRSDEYTKSLTAQVDLADQLASNIRDAGAGLADAFGSAGRALGGLASSMAEYSANQLRLNDGRSKELAIAAQLKNADARLSEERRVNAQWDAREGQAQIQLYGDMTAAGQQFFKKGQLGYEALGAAEKIFRAIQFANSVQAMAQDLKETISSVFNSGRKSVAEGTEGIAHQSKLTFPLNIIAMAATAAALVSAGVSVLGGGGGSGPAIPTAEDYQKTQGTGTVLGDATAKSDSIAKSIDILAKNSNTDLEYGSAMVKALNAIETNIGGLAAVIGRQLNIGGGLDPSKLGLGTNTSGGVLGIGGLFSKTVTTALNDAGLQFDATTVGQAIAGNIQANLYQEILKTTKSSGFFGIGGSTKTTTQTVTSSAPGDLTSEVSLLIGNMKSAIVAAAGTIGVDGASAMLDQFQISIGRISLKGLTASEIQDQLAAVFSAVGDQMATAIAGPLGQYQQAGEGMLQTLIRLAKEYATVDTSLRSIGMTFGSVGLASLGARDALVQLFGGLDNFTQATSFFRDNFLSEAEQMAPIIASVKAEMDRLGEAGVTTKDQFKQLVLGLDLSTDAGRQLYADLMAVAPAFAKVADYTAQLNGDLQNTAKTAEQLAEIAKQRRSLDIDLMEATGDAAGALAAKRSDELAQMDETLRALQQQVWAAQDQAAAATAQAAADAAATQAAQALATQRRSLEIDLMEASGDAAGAAAAMRADELVALDASLRPLKEAIYAAQDNAAAQAALAAAQDEAAKTAATLATQRRSMEIDLMTALGDTAGAAAAKRQDELAALDASLRPLQEQINAANDAAAANAALAQAQSEASAAASQATAAAEQLRQTRVGMEAALLEAMGDATGALAIRRREELAQMDASLRPLQQAIYLQQDLAAARTTLTDSYKRESDALQSTVDKFTSFGASLRTFRATLGDTGDAAVDAYRAAQAKFVDTSALAARGDETALASLEQVSKDFLTASKDRSATLLDYQRDVARVAGSVDRAIGASDTAADYAKLQLDAMKQSVAGLITIDQSVVSVHDAIVSLQNLLAGGPAIDPSTAADLPATAYVGPSTSAAVAVDVSNLEARVDAMAANMTVQNTSIAESVGKMARFMDRWDGNGLLVRADEDEPLPVKVED